MYKRHRMGSTARTGNFPVFGPDGTYIDSAQMLATPMVIGINPEMTTGKLTTMSISPATMPDPNMALEVSYTGDPAFDAKTENGGAEPEGSKMLTWLAVGGIALFALFGKNILKASR